MSTRELVLTILLMVSFFSCRNKIVSVAPEETTQYNYSKDSLYLYFTGGFRESTIEIMYSNIKIQKNDITTDESLGFAAIEILPLHVGDTISVRQVNIAVDFDLIVPDSSNNHIGVWYDHIRDSLLYIMKEDPFTFE